MVNRNEVFVTFKVEKSDYFRRDGSDIHTDAKISISQALLGGTIRVRGIYEDHTVQVMFQIYLLKSGLKKIYMFIYINKKYICFYI